MKNHKAEIATLLTLSLVLVGALITLGTSLFISNKKTNIASNPRAQEPCEINQRNCVSECGSISLCSSSCARQNNVPDEGIADRICINSTATTTPVPQLNPPIWGNDQKTGGCGAGGPNYQFGSCYQGRRCVQCQHGGTWLLYNCFETDSTCVDSNPAYCVSPWEVTTCNDGSHKCCNGTTCLKEGNIGTDTITLSSCKNSDSFCRDGEYCGKAGGSCNSGDSASSPIKICDSTINKRCCVKAKSEVVPNIPISPPISPPLYLCSDGSTIAACTFGKGTSSSLGPGVCYYSSNKTELNRKGCEPPPLGKICSDFDNDILKCDGANQTYSCSYDGNTNKCFVTGTTSGDGGNTCVPINCSEEATSNSYYTTKINISGKDYDWYYVKKEDCEKKSTSDCGVNCGVGTLGQTYIENKVCQPIPQGQGSLRSTACVIPNTTTRTNCSLQGVDYESICQSNAWQGKFKKKVYCQNNSDYCLFKSYRTNGTLIDGDQEAIYDYCFWQDTYVTVTIKIVGVTDLYNYKKSINNITIYLLGTSGNIIGTSIDNKIYTNDIEISYKIPFEANSGIRSINAFMIDNDNHTYPAQNLDVMKSCSGEVVPNLCHNFTLVLGVNYQQ